MDRGVLLTAYDYLGTAVEGDDNVIPPNPLPDEDRPKDLKVPNDIDDKGDGSTICFSCRCSGFIEVEYDIILARKHEDLPTPPFMTDETWEKHKKDFFERIQKMPLKTALKGYGESTTRPAAEWKAKKVVKDGLWEKLAHIRGGNAFFYTKYKGFQWDKPECKCIPEEIPKVQK